jgi:hypothetical protein
MDKYLKRGRNFSDTDNMKRFNVKCQSDKTEYIDILKETEEELIVRFTRLNDGHERTTDEIITRHLFNICLQTGYLYPIEEPVASVA